MLGPALIWQLLIFALLGGVLLAIGRRSRGWPADDETLAIPRAIAARPFASALLVALIATPLAIRHAPIVVYDVVFLLMAVPLARVLPPLAPRALRVPIYAAVALLVVNRVEGTLAEGSALRRVVMLAEGAVVAGALVAWLRARFLRAGSSPDERAVRIATGLGVALLAVIVAALIANVLGYVFLATMLTRGVGASTYAGLSMIGAVLVAQALVDLAIRSEIGQRLHMFRREGALVHRRTLRAMVVIAGLLWAGATLAAFGLAQPASRWAEDALSREWEIGTLHLSLGAVLISLVILVATFAAMRLARFVLELDVLPRMKLEPGVDGAISGLTRYLIFGVGLLLALASVGIDASQIALVAGALGVGVGFGLQGIVANFIAGIVLMLERPVRLGDFIEIGTLVGSVQRIGLRSSTVRANDGAEVIVPNESLISRELVNWTLSDRKRRIDVKVGVAYGSDPHRVLEILRDVAASHADILGGTPPLVLFEGFGESSLDFVVRFWTADFADWLRLRSEVGIRVYDALAEAGIEIPFPQRDLHLRSVSPAAAAVVRGTPGPT